MSTITQISSLRNIDSTFVQMVLQYFEDPDFVDTYEKYDDIFRIRHDFVHWNICNVRGVSFGEKSIELIPELKNMSNHKNWELVRRQSPDIIQVIGDLVKITEITVSSSRLAERDKITKYALLIDTMKKSGFKVDLEIIVVGSTMSESAVRAFSEEHKVPLEVANSIHEVISKVGRLIHAIESTPIGQLWHSRRYHEDFKDIDVDITKNDIISTHRAMQYKCFNSEDEIMEMLDHSPFDHILTDEDNKFIENVVNQSLDMKSDLLKQGDCETAINELRAYHDKWSNTTQFRSFFPLPFIQGIVMDSSRRSTDDDESEFVKFKSLLTESKDPLMTKLAQMTEHRGKVHLDQAERANIALEGPGRKHYIKNKSQPHIEAQKKNRNYWFNYQRNTYENELDDLTQELSQIYNIDLEKPYELQGVGLELLRCYQSIFREIDINAMRSDRRHEFIFKPTGVKDVYLLLFPGPKLRTGENISTIWFKLLSRPSIAMNKYSNHWSFKKWNSGEGFLYSNWISIDANRLDHYLRCYDKVLMAYFSYIHWSAEHLDKAIRSDKSNTLGVILSIYLEDKRSTSKMLQDVRYLVMGSLSRFRWWGSLLEKYHEPVRTPLQAYLLKKIELYCLNVNQNLLQYVKAFRFGKVHQESDVINDKLAGVVSDLPRVLTRGNNITFQQLLCEMYFTMLFNKNQDDPTHSTFQILDKMLAGEQSLKEVKEGCGLHMGGSDPINDANYLIHNPHKNQFSKFALIIGSKLQAMDVSNKSPAGLAHRKASQNKFLNKPLSEFATYKSSAVFERDFFSDEIRQGKVTREVKVKDGLEEKYREGADDDDVDPINHNFPRQNPRRRCIEGVTDLLCDGHLRSFDVIQSTIRNPMYFQVFKKNQIGGAREILILPIEKRITINVLESFSRLICKEDDREMLTHGDVKLTMLRDMIRDVRRSDIKKRIVLNFNLDKTRWGPSFMPIQFAYLFKPFAHNYPRLFNFILLSLIVHSNKKCLIPEKLIHVWLRDSNNDKKHNEPLLQKLKEKFLEDKRLSFDNESNMGQGILHYTSSYLHLCALSFRDHIYKRLCQKANLSPGVWKDMVSSDDSYTALAMELDRVKLINMRIELFVRAQEVTERLFNIWTSKSKSSISYLISEFNSTFGSNLTVFPALFKFSLSSVNPVNTDSFFRMVKESYNTSRQIVENGGSLELYMISHHLNKAYCESIYHTHEGGQNDFAKFNLSRENVPYQLGTYPIQDPAIMLILGPECHNYDIMRRFHTLKDDEKNLFTSCHNIVAVNNPEIYSDLNSFDNIFTGMLRIEAATGPVRKLQRIKRMIDMSWADMQTIIEDDITVLLREPRNLSETKLLTYTKLFSYGASEALRDTAASIYYARVSASVTAKAFHIPYEESMSAKYGIDPEDQTKKKKKKLLAFTYQECLQFLIEKKNDLINLDIYYPHMREYNDLYELSKSKPRYYKRNEFETQNIRSLQLTEITMRIKNPIRDLIEQFWMKPELDKTTSYYRDWVTLKELVPIIEDDLGLTLDNLQGTKTTKIKTLILVLMRIMSYTNKPMKAVVYGPSTRTYDQTYLTLIQQNLFHSFTSTELIINQNLESLPRIYDRLYYYYNRFFLSLWEQIKPEFDLKDLPINDYLRDNIITKTSKKKIMIMLMYFGYLDDYKSWTGSTHSIMHYWVRRQSRSPDGTWSGPFELRVQCGVNKLTLKYKLGKYKVSLSELKNGMLNYELFKSACELVQKAPETIEKELEKGRFLFTGASIEPIIDPNGKHVTVESIEDILIDVGECRVEETKEGFWLTIFDTDGYQVMRTPAGLMVTDYIPANGEFPDFNISGLSLNRLSEHRIFSMSFDFDQITPLEMIDILNDIEVPRPKISEITKKRLRGIISNAWEIKGEADMFREMNDEFEEEKIIDDLIQTEPDPITFDVDIKDPDVFDSMIDPSFAWDLINTLPTVKVKFQPQRILERVINAKYHFIARSCCDPFQLSSSVIHSIYGHTKNKYLVYALAYLYDKYFTNQEVISPQVTEITWRRAFMEKFIEMEDFEVD